MVRGVEEGAALDAGAFALLRCEEGCRLLPGAEDGASEDTGSGVGLGVGVGAGDDGRGDEAGGGGDDAG